MFLLMRIVLFVVVGDKKLFLCECVSVCFLNEVFLLFIGIDEVGRLSEIF